MPYIMKKVQTLCLLFILSTHIYICAQKNNSLFKAGVTTGVNLTQIDGDDQFGYNRRGYNFGLRGAVILRKDMDISTELLFSQRGTQPNTDEKLKNKRTVNVSLNYAEVPFLFNYYYDRSDIGHYRWNIYAGFSYGRLLKSQTSIFKGYFTDTIQQNLVNTIGYNTSDFSLIFGIKRYFTPRFGFSLRHTASLNLLYKNPQPVVVTRVQPVNKNYTSFRSFFISVNVFYDFITPKLAKPRKGKGGKATPKKDAPKGKKYLYNNNYTNIS
jgi:hypothetical protein